MAEMKTQDEQTMIIVPGTRPSKVEYAISFASIPLLLTLFSDMVKDAWQGTTYHKLSKNILTNEEGAVQALKEYHAKSYKSGTWLLGIGAVATVSAAIYGWFKGKEHQQEFDQQHEDIKRHATEIMEVHEQDGVSNVTSIPLEATTTIHHAEASQRVHAVPAAHVAMT